MSDVADRLREVADEIDNLRSDATKAQERAAAREAEVADWIEQWGDTPNPALGLPRNGSAALEEHIELEMWSKPGAEGALCHLCPLAQRPMVPTYVPEEYDGTLLVGEAPGGAEVAKGRGFVGPSGRLLEETYRSRGGHFDRAARTNAVLCRPPAERNPNRPTKDELACCAPRLKAELDQLSPTKTLALGRVAVEQMTEVKGVPIKDNAWTEGVFTALHPAFVLRQGDAFPLFQRSIDRFIVGPQGGDSALQEPPEVTVIESKKHLAEVFASIPDQSWVAFDIETDQVVWYDRMFPDKDGQTVADQILCLVFTTGLNYGWVIPDWMILDVDGVPAMIEEFFARIRTIAHNGKFDEIFLRKAGIKVHVDFDTILLHYCLDEQKGTHGLKQLAQDELNIPDYEAELVTPYLKKKSSKYSDIPEDKLHLYAVWDVCATLGLAAKFKRRAMKEKQWETPFLNLRMPNNRVLVDIEYRGVRVDIPYLQLWQKRLTDRAEFIRRKIAAYAGNPDFNPNSVPQMQELLFKRLRLPMTEGIRSREGGNSGATASKKGSTSLQALTPLRELHPVVNLVREFRTCKKMKATYIDNLLESADRQGRVHTTYSQFGTVTSRLSSQDPALQNIPRGGSFYGQIIKAAFIASEGKAIIDADYAQAQLRIFAALTNDPFIINVYANDLDLHDEVMVAQYGPADTLDARQKKQYRYYCKVFNFGWAFGGGAEMLAELMPNYQMALEFVAKYEKNMPVAAQWRRDQMARAAKYGYVESRLGARRRGYLGSLGGPEAINAPVQAGEAEIQMRSAQRLNSMGYDLLLLVHDSILAEIEEHRGEELRAVMKEVMEEEGARLFPEVKWRADVDPLYDPKTGVLRTRWMDKPSEEEVEAWLKSAEVDDEADGVFGDVAAKRE